MTRKKEGTKRIHLNIEVTDMQFQLFKSLGSPKDAFLELLNTRMSSEQRYRQELELKRGIIYKTQQDVVVLEKMIQAAQQNDVVLQASPEVEEMRAKLTVILIQTPFEKWTQLHKKSAVESKLWTNVAELKAWVNRKQNGGIDVEQVGCTQISQKI